MAQESLFVGIDVAKARLDLAIHASDRPWSTPNDAAGVAALVARLHPLAPTLVVLEATGGLERLVADALHQAGLPVAVVNPRQVRDFARATGRLAKTDTLDARILAHFAQAIRPAPDPAPDPARQSLTALLTRRRQVVGILVSERSRLTMATVVVRSRIDTHVAWLEQEVTTLDAELRAAIEASPVWREHRALLQSVPGVGPVLALTLVAELPQLVPQRQCGRVVHMSGRVVECPIEGFYFGARARHRPLGAEKPRCSHHHQQGTMKCSHAAASRVRSERDIIT